MIHFTLCDVKTYLNQQTIKKYLTTNAIPIIYGVNWHLCNNNFIIIASNNYWLLDWQGDIFFLFLPGLLRNISCVDVLVPGCPGGRVPRHRCSSLQTCHCFRGQNLQFWTQQLHTFPIFSPWKHIAIFHWTCLCRLWRTSVRGRCSCGREEYRGCSLWNFVTGS